MEVLPSSVLLPGNLFSQIIRDQKHKLEFTTLNITKPASIFMQTALECMMVLYCSIP
eukprot:UN10877